MALCLTSEYRVKIDLTSWILLVTVEADLLRLGKIALRAALNSTMTFSFLSTLQLLTEQVEIDLGYDEGSLNKWHNFLGRTLRDFFKSKNPASVHTALTWAAKGPEPAAVPRHTYMTSNVGHEYGNTEIETLIH